MNQLSLLFLTAITLISTTFIPLITNFAIINDENNPPHQTTPISTDTFLAMLKNMDYRMDKISEQVDKLEKLIDKMNVSSVPARPRSQSSTEPRRKCFNTSNPSLGFGVLLQTLSTNVDTRSILKLIELDNHLLASFSADYMVKIWNLTSASRLKIFEISKKSFTTLEAISFGNNDTIAISIVNEPLKLWNLKNLTSIKNALIGSPDLISPKEINTGKLLLLSDGTLASLHKYPYEPYFFRVWSAENPNILVRTFSLDERTMSINSMCLLPDGNIALGHANQSLVEIWNPKEGEFVRTLSSNLSVSMSVYSSFNNDMVVLSNGYLVSTSEPGLVVWDPRTGECVRVVNYPYPNAYVNYLKRKYLKRIYVERLVRLDNGLVAVASVNTNILNVWNMYDGTLVKTLVDEDYEASGGIYAMSVLSDGNLASSYYEARARVYAVKIWRTGGFCSINNSDYFDS